MDKDKSKDIKCITIGDQAKSMMTMVMMQAQVPRLNSLSSKDLKGRGGGS